MFFQIFAQTRADPQQLDLSRDKQMVSWTDRLMNQMSANWQSAHKFNILVWFLTTQDKKLKVFFKSDKHSERAADPVFLSSIIPVFLCTCDVMISWSCILEFLSSCISVKEINSTNTFWALPISFMWPQHECHLTSNWRTHFCPQLL